MITTDELSKMPEIEVIKIIQNPSTCKTDYNRASEYLIKKYVPMIHKHFWTLQKQLDRSRYVATIKNDYYDEAYEALFKAILKVDTTKVYDKKFKLVQMASWYVGNVRNKYVKQVLKKNSKTKSLTNMSLDENEESTTIDIDVEKAYYETMGYKDDPAYQYEFIDGEENCKQGVAKCFSIWSKDEQNIYKMLEKGKSKAEIARQMKVSPVKIGTATKKMCQDLKDALNYN